GLGIGDWFEPETALEEMAEGAAGEAFQRCRGDWLLAASRIEPGGGARHEPVPGCEVGGIAGGFGLFAGREPRKRGAHGRKCRGPLATKMREVPAGVTERAVRMHGNDRHGFAELALELRVRPLPCLIEKPGCLEEQPRRIRLAVLAHLTAGVAQ